MVVVVGGITQMPYIRGTLFCKRSPPISAGAVPDTELSCLAERMHASVCPDIDAFSPSTLRHDITMPPSLWTGIFPS